MTVRFGAVNSLRRCNDVCGFDGGDLTVGFMTRNDEVQNEAER